MNLTILTALIQARLRSIWRSSFIRACTLLVILLFVVLDPKMGTSSFTLLCLSTTAFLPIHALMLLQDEVHLREHSYTTNLDITTDIVGFLIAYSIATIGILGLCWIAGFPFSAGQGGGKRLLDGRILHMSTRGSFTLLAKVFFSTIMMVAITIVARRWIWLARGMVIGYWFYCFVLGSIVGSYANMYGFEQGTFPSVFRIIAFPPLAVVNIFAASWLPWVLPCIGFTLLCSVLAIWIQHRTNTGIPLLTKPVFLWATGLFGLIVFLIGEYYFVQFLRETYQGYF